MTYTPKELEQKLTKAENAFVEKDYDASVAFLNDVITHNPETAEAYQKMGAISMRTENPKQALPYLNKAVELAPRTLENWLALGTFYKNIKQYKEALDVYQKALGTFGNQAAILYEAFTIHRILHNNDTALPIIKKILQLVPGNPTYIHAYAKLLKDLDQRKEALEEYSKLLNEASGELHVTAIGEWFDLMLSFRYLEEAHRKVQSLSEAHPENQYLKVLYARSFEALLDNAQALKIFLEAYELNPNDVGVNYNLAINFAHNGKFEEAKKYHTNVLQLNPLYTPSIRALTSYEKASFDSDVFSHLQYALAHLCDLRDDKKADLHYAAGKFFDDNNLLELAFEHYKLGGKLHAKGKDRADIIYLEKIIHVLKNHFPTSLLKKADKTNIQSNKAVFIVGMPRSGTSLIEQIISSFDKVYGAGELEYMQDIIHGVKLDNITIETGNSIFKGNEKITYAERGKRYLEIIEKLAPSDSKRIVDKMPDNFKFLGLIHLILPQAHIIHSRRHPVEICLSAYRLYFANGHYWSDDLKSIGKYYRLYHEIMQFWKEVLPEGTILDVFYEKNIDDLETQSKRIAKHIDVPWDEKCLVFHQNPKIVRTASMTQVRQPIYRSSVNRWQKYEPWLQPLLEEIGDLVEAYEEELEQTV